MVTIRKVILAISKEKWHKKGNSDNKKILGDRKKDYNDNFKRKVTLKRAIVTRKRYQ